MGWVGVRNWIDIFFQQLCCRLKVVKIYMFYAFLFLGGFYGRGGGVESKCVHDPPGSTTAFDSNTP